MPWIKINDKAVNSDDIETVSFGMQRIRQPTGRNFSDYGTVVTMRNGVQYVAIGEASARNTEQLKRAGILAP